MQASRITPPLRGSRRDKGSARSRSGGGQTRRRVSDDWQCSQSHKARRTCFKGTRCPKGAPASGPPPHQPSPFGSASATPPQGGSDTRVLTGNGVYTLDREHGLHPAQETGKAPHASLKYHSHLEGESERQGLHPQSIRRGANAASREGPARSRSGREKLAVPQVNISNAGRAAKAAPAKPRKSTRTTRRHLIP